MPLNLICFEHSCVLKMEGKKTTPNDTKEKTKELNQAQMNKVL